LPRSALEIVSSFGVRTISKKRSDTLEIV